jgi:hypothetical protein
MKKSDFYIEKTERKYAVICKKVRNSLVSFEGFHLLGLIPGENHRFFLLCLRKFSFKNVQTK